MFECFGHLMWLVCRQQDVRTKKFLVYTCPITGDGTQIQCRSTGHMPVAMRSVRSSAVQHVRGRTDQRSVPPLKKMVTQVVHPDKVRVEKDHTLRSALAKSSSMQCYAQDQGNCSKTNFASDMLHHRPGVETNGVSLIGPELSLRIWKYG